MKGEEEQGSRNGEGGSCSARSGTLIWGGQEWTSRKGPSRQALAVAEMHGAFPAVPQQLPGVRGLSLLAGWTASNYIGGNKERQAGREKDGACG